MFLFVNSNLNGSLVVTRNSLEVEVFDEVIYNNTVNGSNITQTIDFSKFFSEDEIAQDWTWTGVFTDENTNVWTTGEIAFIVEATGVLNYIATSIGGVLGIDDLEINQTVMSFIMALIVSLGVTYRFSETGAKDGLWKIFISVFVGCIFVLWFAGYVSDIVMLGIVSFIVVTFAKQMTATASGQGG